MYTNIGIDLTDKKILIIGGGEVALRRAKRLAPSGARLYVISPDIDPGFEGLDIVHIRDKYKKEYIKDSFMVIIASSSNEANQEAEQDSKDLGILVNSAYKSEDSDIIIPAQVFDGHLNISLSTSGKYPALSKYLKEDMKERYKKFTDEYIEILEEIRALVLENYRDSSKEILYNALELDINQLKLYKEKLKNNK